MGIRKKAADAMGVSTDMVQRYMREQSTPTLERLRNLATASGYRYRWLAYAEEPEKESPASDRAWLDGLTLGQRLRIVRAGVLCRAIPQFAAAVGLAPEAVERMERDEEAPPANYIDKVVEVSGVRREWLESRVPPMLEAATPLMSGVIDARLNRDSWRNIGTGGGYRYPSALEAAPASKIMAGGPISTDLLIQVVTAIEQWQEASRGTTRISIAKKAALIAIAYAHFEGKKFEEREMEHIFKLVA